MGVKIYRRSDHEGPSLGPVFLVVVILAVIFVCSLARGALETTTVEGKVLLPSGVVATSGELTITLNQIGSSPDTGSAEEEVVLGWFTTAIGADGSVDFEVVPNDALTPAGTYYQVVYKVLTPVRANWTEKWSVTTSPDPIDIGAITRLDVPPGITVGDFVRFVAVEPSGACTTADDPTIPLDSKKLCVCVASTWSCANFP